MSYQSVRISTLRGDAKISFDLYIQIGGKYIHYIRKGSSFEGERLDKIKQKKVKKLYIVPDDETNYRNYVSESIENAYSDSQKDIHTRVEVIQGAQQANTEELLEDPANQRKYEIAKQGSERYVEFLLREEGALKSLISISNTDNNLAQHGVTVSGLAVAIANHLGITDPKILRILALGALTHDFGHTLYDVALTKPLSQMNPTELELYKKHPRDGAQKVKDLKHFDQVVTQIILEHEEYVNGTGFPQGLNENQIARESLIVGVANAFDRAMSFEGRSATDALKQLSIDKLGLYPLEHLNALKAVLKEKNVV